MGHKFLLTWAFVTGLVAASPLARAEATAEDRFAPVIEALVMVGTRYRYGGTSPETGFDCSGLVAHVYEQAWGIALPRRTADQRHVGRPVRRAELEPGDLVFYNTRNRPYSHVGIYLGEGNFVHSPRAGRRVRVESIDNPYWRARFNGARRLDPPMSIAVAPAQAGAQLQ
jgi:cell wall-associated NlpC family hydrolase